jgi:signal transduction histidine kinase
MSLGIFAELLSRQNILILERSARGAFRPLGRTPDWCSGLLPPNAVSDGSLAPETIFSFLEYFLPEAGRFWADGASGELRSGMWVETSPDGVELHLAATACIVARKKILLIRRLEQEFDQLQSVYQKGRELLLTQERLLAETSKKEILLHCIIHDLAGPLSGITGTLQVLEGEELTAQAARLVELGRRAARQQSRLIDDLLATFRAETGALDTIDPDPAHAPDAVACARDVLDSLLPAFAIREVSARVDVAPGLSGRAPVSGEKGRLERIFHNLVQNALRYSPAKGVVTIGFQRKGSAVRITVEDQGPGVPPEIIPQLFQKFVRGGGNRGKSGLGLYFCRISVEQWGGAIGCEPRPEGGARFWFRLNLVQAAESWG